MRDPSPDAGDAEHRSSGAASATVDSDRTIVYSFLSRGMKLIDTCLQCRWCEWPHPGSDEARYVDTMSKIVGNVIARPKTRRRLARRQGGWAISAQPSDDGRIGPGDRINELEIAQQPRHQPRPGAGGDPSPVLLGLVVLRAERRAPAWCSPDGDAVGAALRRARVPGGAGRRSRGAAAMTDAERAASVGDARRARGADDRGQLRRATRAAAPTGISIC